MASSTERTLAHADYATSNVSLLSDFRKARCYTAEPDPPEYPAYDEPSADRSADAIAAENRIIRRALRILERRARQPGMLLNNPQIIGDWFRLKLAEYEHEVVAVAWLDQRHRLIAFRELFHGTINRAPIHLRELIKSAIYSNAAAAILAHNHPSGSTEVSDDDLAITDWVDAMLNFIDVRLIDHFIVSAVAEPVSLVATGKWQAGPGKQGVGPGV